MPDDDRAMVTGNMQRKFGEGLTCGSSDMLSDRQTDKYPDTDITILCSATGGGVNIKPANINTRSFVNLTSILSKHRCCTSNKLLMPNI